MEFEDIEWHDQILNGIDINRANPGNNDSIELKVVVEGIEMIVLFEDVYYAELKMNFGVVAEESIRYAIVNSDDIDIVNIQRKWSGAGGELEKLFCFELNTNSTNSLIKIYALSYNISRSL